MLPESCDYFVYKNCADCICQTQQDDVQEKLIMVQNKVHSVRQLQAYQTEKQNDHPLNFMVVKIKTNGTWLVLSLYL